MFKYSLLGGALLLAFPIWAQPSASAPYTPSWQVRHHLQWLSDHAGLPLITSHWPLPISAVEAALAQLPYAQSDAVEPQVAWAREEVLRELKARQEDWRLRVQLRARSEALNGFDENYTPGSSVRLESEEWRWGESADVMSAAVRVGGRFEENPNSLQAQFSGHGVDGRWQFRPEGSAVVVGLSGWNAQVFSHRHWWGPAWQSSLVNGHNNPSWTGVGVQRGSVAESQSAWLRWMGPWNLDVFVAKAQDPRVVAQQPSGFLFSGMRLTMKPQPWLELGLSRGFQTGGAGRPNGASYFVKALLGQELNQNPEDTFIDSSGQIAGYDLRLSCPKSWGKLLGTCAAYTQWMGEDAAGKVPLPYKFMSLWGVESIFAQGRHRVFAEWSDTNAYSLPWDTKSTFAGYVNGVYRQGYTQGARWVGSAQGSGSRVMTVGWMDAERLRVLKMHMGRIHTSMGAYDPRVTAPWGDVWGVSATQTLTFDSLSLLPELAYTHLKHGVDQRGNFKKNLRVSVTLEIPI